MTRGHRNTALRQGLAALSKSALLVLGVPLALVRLLLNASPISNNDPLDSEGLWIRVVIALVALMWLRALVSLVTELRRAKRDGTQTTGWSARWAAGLIGLSILLSAASTNGRAPSRTTTQFSTAATRAASIAIHPSSLSAVVANGECLADVAQRTLGERRAWLELYELNADRLLGEGQRLVDPSLLRPGWCLTLPAPAQSPTGSSDRSKLPAGRLDELALLGLGVLTTAALARRIATLRLAVRSSRASGAHSRRGASEVEQTDTAIAPLGSASLLDWIELANRALRFAFEQLGHTSEVRLVRAGPRGISFLLEPAPNAVIAPFEQGPDSRWWTLPLSAPRELLARRLAKTGRCVPWLVPLGDDGSDAWLIALGPGRRLVIEGSDAARRATLSGIVLALRTVPWAEELSVELLDIDAPPGSEHCYQLAESSEAALTELAFEARPSRLEPGVASWRSEPLVVIGDEGHDPQLVSAVSVVSGIVAVEGEGSDRLAIGATTCRLEPLGLELTVPRPSKEACSLIDRLLEHAAAEPELVAVGAPTRRFEDCRVIDAPLRLLDERPRLDSLVGHVAERDVSRVVELLAYLHLSGGSASIEDLLAALLPRGGTQGRARLAALLASARRGLVASGLEECSLVIRAESASIEGTLCSDWNELFDALAACRSLPLLRAKEALTELLDLELHLPPHPYPWMIAEGHLDRLAFRLCDAWHELTSMAISDGDLALAERVVTAGLRVEPTSELLVRDRMILRDLALDHRGALDSYEQLELELATHGGLEPTEETRRLYDGLASRRA